MCQEFKNFGDVRHFLTPTKTLPFWKPGPPLSFARSLPAAESWAKFGGERFVLIEGHVAPKLFPVLSFTIPSAKKIAPFQALAILKNGRSIFGVPDIYYIKSLFFNRFFSATRGISPI